MKIADIDFGQRDARHAATHGDFNEKLFQKIFIEPFGLQKKSYFDGDRLFVLGIKGSGKSAFLKSMEIEKRSVAHTKFVYFSESARELRRSEAGLSNLDVSANEVVDTQDPFDYWVSFFFVLIAKIIYENKETGAKRYLECIRRTTTDAPGNFLQKILGVAPTIESWAMGIKSGVDWRMDGKFTEIVNIRQFYSSAISELAAAKLSKPIYLFVDELEPVFENNERFRREVGAAEALVVTLRDLNEEFRRRGIPIFFICAVRKEIADQILGGDASKVVADLGEEVSWKRSPWEQGNRDYIHPLFEIVLRRIFFAENPDREWATNRGLGSVYSRYFPNTVTVGRVTRPAQAYILDLTTYRPRDLPILFNAAKNVDGASQSFREETFRRLIRQPLRDGLWVDISEALRARFTKEQIELFRKVFERLSNRFTYSDFRAALDDFSGDPTLADLIDRFSDSEWVSLLGQLYVLGAIGNVEKGAIVDEKFMFHFRGYTGGLLISNSVDMVKVRALEDV